MISLMKIRVKNIRCNLIFFFHRIYNLYEKIKECLLISECKDKAEKIDMKFIENSYNNFLDQCLQYKKLNLEVQKKDSNKTKLWNP